MCPFERFFSIVLCLCIMECFLEVLHTVHSFKIIIIAAQRQQKHTVL